jgi:murein DD-endopeptidase MepM/ murein hydrolase activator NlpD
MMRNFKRNFFYINLLAAIVFTGGFFSTSGIVQVAQAQSVSSLERQIDRQKNKLQEIDQEIAKQQAVITVVVGEARTLKQAVNQLSQSEQKLGSEINQTKEVINVLDLEIQKSDIQISEAEKSIHRKRDVIGEVLRNQYQSGEQTLMEHILSNGDFSTAWQDIDTLDYFNSRIIETITFLEKEQVDLKVYQEEQAEKQTVLIVEKTELASEQEAITLARKSKDSLLAQTKNKESEYRKLLNKKVAEREAFEEELFAYQAALIEVLTASEIPDASTEGLVRWPVDNVIITQRFGKTGDSGRLYASGTHNGIDIGVSVGTRIYSTQSGVVKGLGNTDAFPGCYSYGKWMLVEHDNGLSTLYAHLSSQIASTGQRVAAGDPIALSGNTGYSTGPHLHMTLFASQGVAIKQYIQSNGCKQASIPLSTKQGALLDPMEYLPEL